MTATFRNAIFQKQRRTFSTTQLASTHHQMTDTDETVWGEEQNEHLVAVMDRDSDGSVDREVC